MTQKKLTKIDLAIHRIFLNKCLHCKQTENIKHTIVIVKTNGRRIKTKLYHCSYNIKMTL